MKLFKRILILTIALSLVVSFCSCAKLQEINPFKQKAKQTVMEVDDDTICTLLDRACIAAAMDERDGVGYTKSNVMFSTVAILEAGIEPVKKVYEAHLEEEMVNGYYLKSKDFDDDGTKELVFVLNNINPSWSGSSELLEDDFDMEDNAFSGMDMVVIYCDEHKGTTVAQAFAVKEEKANSDIILSWDNGIFTIAPKGTSGSYYKFNINDAAFTLNADNNIGESINSYARYLDSLGYIEIKAQTADISDIPGNEVIFVYNSGSVYRADIFSIHMGRLYKLHSVSDEDNVALFAVTVDGVDYLLNYTQEISTTNENYRMKYSYVLYRFDAGTVYSEFESNSINRSDTDAATDAETEFFSKLNEYLKNSVVCNDPFEISGYRTTISAEDVDLNNLAYVKISNCSTLKTGTVDVPSNTFLFMRSGPSKNYDPILVNSYDDDSFIKLLRGTPVTILDAVNTGDKENPVWLKIRVKYGEETFIGYSSQRYITISGIESVSVGSTFDINTTADTSNLTWEVNDPTIANVDDQGVVTGVSKGLVLVSVRANSGYSDSCLIFVQ